MSRSPSSPSSASDKTELTYANSGVDISAGEQVVSRIKSLARDTFTPDTLSDIGSFGALFKADFGDIKKPALVSSADGVGTKLKLAFMTGKHDTVGEDLVNHCVNDILVQGARPLFFLDYFATGTLSPDVAVATISGISRGCKNHGMAFIGGETAEMPDFYSAGEYDLAGFIVGVVDQDKIIDGSAVQPGDTLLGVASSGLHTNGFSLARKAIFERAEHTPDEHIDQLGCSIAESLMKVHTSYLQPVQQLFNELGSGSIHGMAHITGGGIAGNLGRIIPEGLQAQIKPDSWPTLPVFDFIQDCGGIAEEEMRKAFNLGVGFVLVVAPGDVDRVGAILRDSGHESFTIGAVASAPNELDAADSKKLRAVFL
jgi:phosphoribosylformylglycinamidine cyclo-ligase